MTWAVDYTSPTSSAVASVIHFLHGLLLTYRPRKDERQSCPRWLTHSGQFTHKVATCPAIGQVRDRESSSVKDQRSKIIRNVVGGALFQDH